MYIVRQAGNKEILAIVEIDGPYHYYPNRKLRRKDQMKEMMYRKVYPNAIFRRIRYDDENRLGSSA